MVRILRKGDQGNDVKQVQTWLNSKGIDCGPADGYFGPRTEAAVVWFQAMNGTVWSTATSVDGVFWQVERQAMSHWRTMKKGDQNIGIYKDITSLQKYLRGTNLYMATVDGYFGPITETAVKKFQQKVKIFVDGIVGPQTIKAMKLYPVNVNVSADQAKKKAKIFLAGRGLPDKIVDSPTLFIWTQSTNHIWVWFVPTKEPGTGYNGHVHIDAETGRSPLEDL